MNKFEPDGYGRALPARSGYGPPGFYHPFGWNDDASYRPDQEEGADPIDLLLCALRYRWLLAGFVIAGLIVGVLATYLQTPLYRATADVEIVPSGAKIFQDLEVIVQASDIRAVETAREKMLSRSLARRVVFKLDLAENGEFLAPAPAFSLMNLVRRATGSSARAALGDLTAEEREAMAVRRVMKNLTVEPVDNTSILSVSFSHADPKLAAAVANQVVHSYIDQKVDKKSETSELARQFIDDQVRESKEKLEKSEKALVAYANKAGITVTGDRLSLVAQNIAEINEALGKAIEERIAAETYYNQVRGGEAASLPEVFKSESIERTKERIAELKAAYRRKLGKLKPEFPEMRHLRAQIAALQEEVDAEVAAIGKSVEIRYRQASEKVATLKRELASLKAQQSQYHDKRIRYDILQREVESNRQQYESLVSKLNEVGVGSDLKTVDASIVDPAVVPRFPYTPRLSRTVALTLALFAAMAAALVYLFELTRNTFAAPDQVESELKLPILGILPTVTNGNLGDAFADNKSSISEAFRSLRTSLQFTGTEQAMRTILVTSAEESEGKSTVACKMAQDFAALGRKVLVIDADLRKPCMHRLFGRSNALGLSNLLSNVVQKSEVRTIFLETDKPGVTLLPAGTIPPNPVELLMSPRMVMALDQCANLYDLIIIDGPPVLGLSDAPILSRHADATLMVVSINQVTRKAAKSALARLRAASGNVVGAVVNKFTIEKFDYGQAYRYLRYDYYGYSEAPAGIEDHASSGRKTTNALGRVARAVSALLDRLRRSVG